MKIVKTIIKEFEFSPEKERMRIKDVFEKEEQTRQLAILDAFVEGDLDKMHNLYDDLPYSEDSGCSEKEFVGLWFHTLFYGGNEYWEKNLIKKKETKELSLDGKVVCHVEDSRDNSFESV